MQQRVARRRDLSLLTIFSAVLVLAQPSTLHAQEAAVPLSARPVPLRNGNILRRANELLLGGRQVEVAAQGSDVWVVIREIVSLDQGGATPPSATLELQAERGNAFQIALTPEVRARGTETKSGVKVQDLYRGVFTEEQVAALRSAPSGRGRVRGFSFETDPSVRTPFAAVGLPSAGLAGNQPMSDPSGGATSAASTPSRATPAIPGVRSATLTPAQWMTTGRGAIRAAGFGTFACDVVQIDASAFPDGGRLVIGVELGTGASSAFFSLYPDNVTVIPPAKQPDAALASVGISHNGYGEYLAPGWVGGLTYQFGPTDPHRFQLCAQGSWRSAVNARNTYAYRIAVDPIDAAANLSSPRPRLPLTAFNPRDSVGLIVLTPDQRRFVGTRSIRAAGNGGGWGTFACDLMQIDTRAFPAGGRLMVGLQLGDGESGAAFTLFPEQVTVVAPSNRPADAIDQTGDVQPGWVGGLSTELSPRRTQIFQLCAEGSATSRAGARNSYTYQVTFEPARKAATTDVGGDGPRIVPGASHERWRVVLPAAAQLALRQWDPTFDTWTLSDYDPSVRRMDSLFSITGLPWSIVRDVTGDGTVDVVLAGHRTRRGRLTPTVVVLVTEGTTGNRYRVVSVDDQPYSRGSDSEGVPLRPMTAVLSSLPVGSYAACTESIPLPNGGFTIAPVHFGTPFFIWKVVTKGGVPALSGHGVGC